MYGTLIAPSVLLLALSFPRAKPFFLRRTALVSTSIYTALPLMLVVVGPQPVIGWGWAACCGVLSLVTVGHTLVYVRDAVSRAQLRWAGLGLASFALSIVLEATSGFGAYSDVAQQVIAALAPFLQLALTMTLAVAIMRYRLFDIDFILSRTLVYATLTLSVIGLYIGLVTYLSALFRSENTLISSLIATGVVAVVFQPLHMRLQRAVNSLLFGQRDDPYAVITDLGRRLEVTVAPTGVFNTIVETIGRSLKLPYVAIATADEAHVHAAFPATAQPPATRLVRLPLMHQHQVVGTLLATPRAGEERFTDADERLLDDLARQIGIAVYAARMTANVQRSRERIVLAREEERRRLRRDLHDGLGPQLASQTLTLDVIARLVRSDPDQARTLLLTVREQLQQAVSDIRDLIYGLRPLVLDDLGLNGAVEEWIDRVRQQHTALNITLHLPTEHIQLPAALEVAAYRIVQEAVTNVIRHARANKCEIHMSIMQLDRASYSGQEQFPSTHVVIEVVDDGIGIEATRSSGVGLQSMRERSEELGGVCRIEARSGGGTSIRACIPMTHVRLTDDDQDPDR